MTLAFEVSQEISIKELRYTADESQKPHFCNINCRAPNPAREDRLSTSQASSDLSLKNLKIKKASPGFAM